MTRAMDPNGELNDNQIRHLFQTSNIVTIMDHVMLKDTIYVMTLSKASMNDLKMTQEDIKFAKEYVRLLNETVREAIKTGSGPTVF